MQEERARSAAARLLSVAADPDGRGPLPWVAGPLRDATRVLDLGCATGPLASVLGAARWVGVDPRAAPGASGPVLRARPDALPLRENAVDGIAVLLALPLLGDVDAVFAEIRRVLRPAGTLVALVPSASVRSVAEFRLRRVLAPVARGPWPNRSALDHLGWILAAADFAVLTDDRVPFALPLPDAEAAHRLVDDLPAAGLWPPGLPVEVRAELAAGLARRSGPGRVLPLPLRRVVARR